jgi:hypothetical protein
VEFNFSFCRKNGKPRRAGLLKLKMSWHMEIVIYRNQINDKSYLICINFTVIDYKKAKYYI